MKKLILINSETENKIEQLLDEDIFDLFEGIRRRNKITNQSEFWSGVLSQVLFDLNIK